MVFIYGGTEILDKNKLEIIRIKMKKIAAALENNNFMPFCVDTAQEAIALIKELIPKGASVGVGGSATLNELSVIELLRSGDYNFFDRYDKSLSPGGVTEVMKKSLTADVFLTSTNAVTEDGELYNVDGNANRVSAMLFGPDSVIVVAGYNKIVKDIAAAKQRVKDIAAPANCVRLGIDNPCTKNGSCCDCKVQSRICCDTVIMSRQRIPGRVKVILVAQELGY